MACRGEHARAPSSAALVNSLNWCFATRNHPGHSKHMRRVLIGGPEAMATTGGMMFDEISGRDAIVGAGAEQRGAVLALGE
jgi:hypothetical protein